MGSLNEPTGRNEATASSPRPSPPGEERENRQPGPGEAQVHGPNACAKRKEAFQEQYDDAMFDFSTGDYDSTISKLKDILAQEPEHFEAQLALGMAYYRKGDYATAIAEGHKAEKLKPSEQLVHTNLSLFYMKSGDKKTAEHHGLQARIASWKADKTPPGEKPAGDPELEMAKPPMPAVKPPEKFPDMPWKKKT